MAPFPCYGQNEIFKEEYFCQDNNSILIRKRSTFIKGCVPSVSVYRVSIVRYLVKVLNFLQYSVYDFSLGPLVNKVKEFQVETIVEALCGNMVSEKEQLRDISSIGLKTVISELPLASSTLAASVCKRITGKLSSAIEKVQLEQVPSQWDCNWWSRAFLYNSSTF